MVTTATQHRNLQVLVAIGTLIFLSVSVWNIYEAHKYRKLEYELKNKID